MNRRLHPRLVVPDVSNRFRTHSVLPRKLRTCPSHSRCIREETRLEALGLYESELVQIDLNGEMLIEKHTAVAAALAFVQH